MISLSVLSTKYVDVIVTAGGINPTSDVVKFAFMPVPGGGTSSNPGPADWHTGGWTTPSPGVYVAQCLVGPATGGVALTVGTYTIWLQIVDNPEVPVDPIGTLQIV